MSNVQVVKNSISLNDALQCGLMDQMSKKLVQNKYCDNKYGNFTVKLSDGKGNDYTITYF